MRTRTSRRLTALLATSLLFTACADDEPEQIGADTGDPEPEEPTEPEEPQEPEDPSRSRTRSTSSTPSASSTN